MSRNVFILGAGASREAGAPLMNDFLDKAEKIYLYEQQKLFHGRTLLKESILRDYDNVFKVISNLQIIHSKSYLDLYNIEILFGAIEMGKLLNYLLGYAQEEIELFRSSIINLIVKTLEATIEFPTNVIIDSDDEDDPFCILGVPNPYNNFVSLLTRLPEGSSSVLTFNYDVSLDYALYKNSISVNYFLNKGDYNPEGYNLLKLHGSINWGKCQQCGEIVAMSFDDFIKQNRITPDVYQPYNNFFISDGLMVFSHDNCKQAVGSRVNPAPVIVPPTWNKTEYHSNLANVWSQAAQELSEAVNIFVIGYSFPETDSFFRYLYALGTISSNRIKNFWVFNPDGSGEVDSRFSKIIGQGVRNRYKYEKLTFGEAINYIYDNREKL